MNAELRNFIAARIRSSITEASLDLKMSPKSKIEHVIKSTMEKAEAAWPMLERERRKHTISDS